MAVVPVLNVIIRSTWKMFGDFDPVRPIEMVPLKQPCIIQLSPRTSIQVWGKKVLVPFPALLGCFSINLLGNVRP
jgi:hypothetical protein